MKHVAGLREGATENATVVRELLEDCPRVRGLHPRAPLCAAIACKA
jgi:hypothetical protein